MKTTVSDFKRFKKYCQQWQDVLGVNNWAVYYKHDDMDDAYAKTWMNLTGAVATICFAKHFDEFGETTDEFLNRTALHEVLHIVMRPLVAEAEDRFTTQSAIDIAEHSIIRQLENLIPGGIKI